MNPKYYPTAEQAGLFKGLGIFGDSEWIWADMCGEPQFRERYRIHELHIIGPAPSIGETGEWLANFVNTGKTPEAYDKAMKIVGDAFALQVEGPSEAQARAASILEITKNQPAQNG